MTIWEKSDLNSCKKNISLVAFHQKKTHQTSLHLLFFFGDIYRCSSRFLLLEISNWTRSSIACRSCQFRVIESSRSFHQTFPSWGDPLMNVRFKIYTCLCPKVAPLSHGLRKSGEEFQNHSEDWHLAHPDLKKNNGKWHLESEPQAHAQGGVGTQKTSYKLWVLQIWYQIIVQVQKKCITITK